MKNSILTKYLLTIIVIGIIGFFSIKFITTPIAEKNVRSNFTKTLYDQAFLLAKSYRDNNYVDLNEYLRLSTNISSLNSITKSSIWIISSNGKLIYDSSNISKNNTRVYNFSLDYFSDKNYATGTFFDYVPPETLSVIAPITSSFETVGYIIIHKTKASLETEVSKTLSNNYIYYVSAFLICFIFFTTFIIRLKLSIDKIKTASKEYSIGNIKYGNIHIKAHDELGQIADNLEYMSIQLNNTEENQHKFIANVSHDFRSPLTSIKGYAEAMLDGTIPVEMQEKYLKIVVNETERLNKLTTNLLSVNSWDNRGRQLMISDFDIILVIKKALATFEGTCKKKKITFDVTYGAKSYMVKADMSKIQQVLYNLIDNALKFSPSDSTIEISAMAKNEKIYISIKDHGIGIPKDSLLKIWDRFYKTDLSRGKDKTGSGLGLSITKEIINSHNENIDVISTEGVGTEFIFSLKRS